MFHTHAFSQFQTGMIVRVPFDLGENNGAYRDFRVGSMVALDPVARTVRIRFLHHSPGEKPRVDERDYDAALVHRCHITNDTICTHLISRKQVRVLVAVDDNDENGQFVDYFVDINGDVQRVSERNLFPPAHCQRPQVGEQLLHYEFHNPVFRIYRDQLVTRYQDLKTAVFGLEDLIGTRVLLLAHQAETIARVLTEETPRFILADEVGLGKTIEACVILKGLTRRFSRLKTLIIVPASLVKQWFYELDQKFWLRFPSHFVDFKETMPGMLITAEDLEHDDSLWSFVKSHQWDLLIADEAHHLHKRNELYQKVYSLSQQAKYVLILSATPIQRRAQELFYLLRLLDPSRYGQMNPTEFQHTLDRQEDVRRVVSAMRRMVGGKRFDPDDFLRRINPLIEQLEDDSELVKLTEELRTATTHPNKGMPQAQDILHYISTNYRLENHMIRNRRATLSEFNVNLPERQVDVRYCYEADELEAQTHETLYRYMEAAIEMHGTSPYLIELVRLLFHAASSNPHTLLRLIDVRRQSIGESTRAANETLLRPLSPYYETTRIKNLILCVPSFAEEITALNQITALATRWLDEERLLLNEAQKGKFPPIRNHRLVEVVRAVHELLKERPTAKLLIFSTWHTTLLELREVLMNLYGSSAIAEFHVSIDPKAMQSEVNKFQANPKCHLLLCDELGGEGRNFQIADYILHIDIPWTPAILEQRIGRVDRLGRVDPVVSKVFYADGQTDHALFQIWQEAFGIFTHSLSGMEIALESIQDELLSTFASNPRDGIVHLVEPMKANAAHLRDAVEEERYFEDAAIDVNRRQQFRDMSKRFLDGIEIRRAVLGWAEMAGLRHHFDNENDTVTFRPGDFNDASMKNAKFFDAPNMEDAYARGNTRNLTIKGTFNRLIGVRREDLIFFSPGTDVWTDTIIANALEADRGRCCASGVNWVDFAWTGFDFLYSIQIDPRPLFALGFAPTHLLRAHGYLVVSTYRILVTESGEIVPQGDALYKQLEEIRSGQRKTNHLGKRENGNLAQFKTDYPPDLWHGIVNQALKNADKQVSAEFDFMQDEGQIAQAAFERLAAGMRARQAWLRQRGTHDHDLVSLQQFEQISGALVKGIRSPQITLESACFWVIQPKAQTE